MVLGVLDFYYGLSPCSIRFALSFFQEDDIDEVERCEM
jgi:hypothetical protein